MIFKYLTSPKKISNSLFLLSLSISVVLVLYLQLLNAPLANAKNCREYGDFQKLKLNNLVSDKFLDRNNHLNQTIILDNNEYIILYADTILFRLVAKGDSIIKSVNSSEVTIIKPRNNAELVHKVYFHCELENNTMR